MNNDPNELHSEQSQSSQSANPEATELEALRRELRELKEEIKNKKQLTSGDIAAGVAGGLTRFICGAFVLWFGLMFFVGCAVLLSTYAQKNLPDDSLSSPSPF